MSSKFAMTTLDPLETNHQKFAGLLFRWFKNLECGVVEHANKFVIHDLVTYFGPLVERYAKFKILSVREAIDNRGVKYYYELSIGEVSERACANFAPSLILERE